MLFFLILSLGRYDCIAQFGNDILDVAFLYSKKAGTKV